MAVAVAAARHWRRLGPEARFPLRFVAILTLLGVVALGGVVSLGDALVSVTVRAVAWAADAVRLDVLGDAGGTMVFGNGDFAYSIVPSCTIAVPGVLYSAAVLAYPARWSERAVGLGAGLPALFAFNTARLVVLAWVGVEARGAFEALHWYGFQILLIFVTGLLFVAWARWVGRRRDGGHAARRWSGTARSAGTFALVFGGLMALGIHEAVVSAYSRVVSGPYLLVGSRLWPDLELMEFFFWPYALMFYATTAAFFALVVATRSHSLKERLWNALPRMFVLLLAVQTVDLLFATGLDLSNMRGGFWASRPPEVQEAAWVALRLVLLVAIPLADWWVWARAKMEPFNLRSKKEAR